MLVLLVREREGEGREREREGGEGEREGGREGEREGGREGEREGAGRRRERESERDTAFSLIFADGNSCEFGSARFYAMCAFGGVLSCGLTHTALVPMDVVKCRIQVRHQTPSR